MNPIAELIGSRRSQLVNHIVYVYHERFHWLVHEHDISAPMKIIVSEYDSLHQNNTSSLASLLEDPISIAIQATRPEYVSPQVCIAFLSR